MSNILNIPVITWPRPNGPENTCITIFVSTHTYIAHDTTPKDLTFLLVHTYMQTPLIVIQRFQIHTINNSHFTSWHCPTSNQQNACHEYFSGIHKQPNETPFLYWKVTIYSLIIHVSLPFSTYVLYTLRIYSSYTIYSHTIYVQPDTHMPYKS